MSAPATRSTEELAQDRTDLALDRTVMAAERNLMAWVRTALSMISFGFTIYKFLESFPSRETLMRPQGPRNVGLLLISMGVISLLLAAVQFVGHLKRLGRPLRDAPRSISLWVAAGVGLFGLLALLNVVFQLGPF